MFISMFTSALTCAAVPGPPIQRIDDDIFSSIGFTRAYAASSPAHIK